MANHGEASDGWATSPQDTRERTCEYGGTAPFSVLHSLRVARAPDPSTTTVARTYEVAVEWTASLDLPAFLSTVAATCTPYGEDRFGAARTPSDAVEDGRFRAAPVDATVRPPPGDEPGLSDPYHYWNTPLARLRDDDHCPDGVSRITVDLAGGPDAVWTDESTAGVPVERLPGDRTDYARVGLEFTARERLERPTGDDDERWSPTGEPDRPDLALLASAVDATLVESVRDGGGAGDDDVRAAVDAVERQVEAVWSAFRWASGTGDPYEIPSGAVDAATSGPD